MSKIEWTDRVWNPTVGCSRVSDGCQNCYAERFAHRGLRPEHQNLTVMGAAGPRWNGSVRLLPDRLAAPLSWKKPMRIFVDSMSDIFHPDVPFEFTARVFATMHLAQHHTFQVLTKRAGRMLRFYKWLDTPPGRQAWLKAVVTAPDGGRESWSTQFPFRNIWLGVSVELQALDWRIPMLLQCPAAVRWVSLEPLLGPINLRTINDGTWHDPEGANRYDALAGRAWWSDGTPGLAGGPRLDWAVIGGESGPGARACDLDWVRSLASQCRDAGVPYFVKQLGRHPIASGLDPRAGDRVPGLPFRNSKGADTDEWPSDLRVQDFPQTKDAA